MRVAHQRAGIPVEPEVEQATLTAYLPFGPCAMVASDRGLLEVRLLDVVPMQQSLASMKAREIVEEARRQLLAYLGGELRVFDVPLDLSRKTEFQQRVLNCCRAIEYGEVATYGELARCAGTPKAARAVGQVMATNSLAIIIPCHRVVGSDGRLTGFASGIDLKAQLLTMERSGESWQKVLN